MWEAWQHIRKDRTVYMAKWQATLESTEALALEKVRARQMMELLEYGGGEKKCLDDSLIRKVLSYVIAGEGEFKIGFLDGNEVTVAGE